MAKDQALLKPLAEKKSPLFLICFSLSVLSDEKLAGTAGYRRKGKLQQTARYAEMPMADSVCMYLLLPLY